MLATTFRLKLTDASLRASLPPSSSGRKNRKVILPLPSTVLTVMLLPGRAIPTALAAGHDLRLGGRTRLDVLDGGDRLLHREIAACQRSLRSSADEAIALIEQGVAA
jgi:hypothetical protein